MANGVFNAFNIGNGSCNLTQNPWCGQFGGRQIFEIIYLSLVAVLGTFGNLLVISSIIYKKRLHKHGNIFIVNLAVADLIVTGIHIPTVIANVIKGGQALPDELCMVVGYVVTITCVCSVCNLTFIAVNRYWAVVHSKSYDRHFSKRNTYLMIVFIWFWSNLLVTPTLYGWSGLGYDFKMLQCAWDDCASLAYNIILMLFAIFSPLCIITWCYYTLFRKVRERGTTIRRITTLSTSSSRPDTKQRIMKREINLLKTLATAVFLFVVCWVPYGICILFFTAQTPPDVKKVVGWLGLSNSAINFVIYGAMNRVFRRGYRDLLVYLFCSDCCKIKSFGATSPAFSVRASQEKKKNSLFNTNSQNSLQSIPAIKKTMTLINDKNASQPESTPPSSLKYSAK